jgi:hypothetical protein
MAANKPSAVDILWIGPDKRAYRKWDEDAETLQNTHESDGAKSSFIEAQLVSFGGAQQPDVFPAIGVTSIVPGSTF